VHWRCSEVVGGCTTWCEGCMRSSQLSKVLSRSRWLFELSEVVVGSWRFSEVYTGCGEVD